MSDLLSLFCAIESKLSMRDDHRKKEGWGSSGVEGGTRVDGTYVVWCVAKSTGVVQPRNVCSEETTAVSYCWIHQKR